MKNLKYYIASTNRNNVIGVNDLRIFATEEEAWEYVEGLHIADIKEREESAAAGEYPFQYLDRDYIFQEWMYRVHEVYNNKPPKKLKYNRTFTYTPTVVPKWQVTATWASPPGQSIDYFINKEQADSYKERILARNRSTPPPSVEVSEYTG